MNIAIAADYLPHSFWYNQNRLTEQYSENSINFSAVFYPCFIFHINTIRFRISPWFLMQPNSYKWIVFPEHYWFNCRIKHIRQYYLRYHTNLSSEYIHLFRSKAVYISVFNTDLVLNYKNQYLTTKKTNTLSLSWLQKVSLEYLISPYQRRK